MQQNGRVAGREFGAAGDCYFGSGVSALSVSSGADLVAVLLKWKLQGTKSVPLLVEEDQIRTRFLVFLFSAFSVTNKSGEIRERGTRKPAYWVVRTVSLMFLTAAVGAAGVKLATTWRSASNLMRFGLPERRRIPGERGRVLAAWYTLTTHG